MNYNDNDDYSTDINEVYDDFYDENSTDDIVTKKKIVNEEPKESKPVENEDSGFMVLCVLEFIIILVIIGYSFFKANNYYEMVFVDNNEIIGRISVLKNTAPRIPTSITKPGYKVSKWICGSDECDFNEPITSDMLVNVEWENDIYDERQDGEVIVSFNSVGGSSVNPIKVKSGSSIKAPEAPIKKGYVFVDWLYNGEPFDFGISITEDITLVARYKKEVIHSGSSSTPTEGSNYKNYTIMVSSEDDESEDCYLTIYENGFAISIKNITYDDGEKISASIKGNKIKVKKADIEGETYFKVTLKTGETVTAEIK